MPCNFIYVLDSYAGRMHMLPPALSNQCRQEPVFMIHTHEELPETALETIGSAELILIRSNRIECELQVLLSNVCRRS